LGFFFGDFSEANPVIRCNPFGLKPFFLHLQELSLCQHRKKVVFYLHGVFTSTGAKDFE
jgi:hypothetical protein